MFFLRNILNFGYQICQCRRPHCCQKGSIPEEMVVGKAVKCMFFLGGYEKMLIPSRKSRVEISKRNWGEIACFFSRFFWHFRAGFWGHKDADPRCYTCRVQNAVSFSLFFRQKETNLTFFSVCLKKQLMALRRVIPFLAAVTTKYIVENSDNSNIISHFT